MEAQLKKRKKQIVVGVILLFFCIILGVVIAILLVENDIPSKASKDGWLGFLGGLIGSFLSGVIAIYILEVNRADAYKALQSTNEETRRIQKDSERHFRYSNNVRLVNDIVNLAAELMAIMQDYYLNFSGKNQERFLDENIRRAQEIIYNAELKLYNINNCSNVIDAMKLYYNSLGFTDHTDNENDNLYYVKNEQNKLKSSISELSKELLK